MKTFFVSGFSIVINTLFALASTLSLADETSGGSGNNIGVHFKVEPSSGQEYMYASEILGAGKSAAHNVFAAITDYPSLHPWIKDVKLVREDGSNKKDFRIDFKFPWPLGPKWSVVEVDLAADGTMTWHQIDGSLKKNSGTISLHAEGQTVRLEYAAVIDVGLPNAWIRHYKRKFVSQFLVAVDKRAVASESGEQYASNQVEILALASDDLE